MPKILIKSKYLIELVEEYLKMQNKKVLLAMSGGVDSSASAIILKIKDMMSQV